MQDQIDTIMDYFDFGRVHRVMSAIGWKWYIYGEYAVPTKQQLCVVARSALQDVAKRGDGAWGGSGGFHAENVNGRLKLMFVVTDWDTFDDADDAPIYSTMVCPWPPPPTGS